MGVQARMRARAETSEQNITQNDCQMGPMIVRWAPSLFMITKRKGEPGGYKGRPNKEVKGLAMNAESACPEVDSARTAVPDGAKPLSGRVKS